MKVLHQMSDLELHIQHMLDAELQFRLASAVRLATTYDRQPSDLPTEWTHGKHRIRFEDIALQKDEVVHAAFLLQRSATLALAVAVKDAVEAIAPCIPNAIKKGHADPEAAIRSALKVAGPMPWKCTDDDVYTIYQISRLIRNAYAHAPFAPVWMIPETLRDKIFVIPDVIELRTKNLHCAAFDWRDYGGPLSLLALCRFARTNMLNHQTTDCRDTLARQDKVIYQQGDLVLEKIEAIPPNAVRVSMNILPDGGIDLGGGHVVYVTKMEK
ncbi:hypothetical protein ACO0LM_22230 [Undibacterium sp. Di26W]|uniref:hypothetical protein n=1 Tax=Undibacterium sp. Di26W TaxID=3413035 RepID=UPI003BEFE16A